MQKEDEEDEDQKTYDKSANHDGHFPRISPTTKATVRFEGLTAGCVKPIDDVKHHGECDRNVCD